jgi:hypothetical protein
MLGVPFAVGKVMFKNCPGLYSGPLKGVFMNKVKIP